MNIENLVKMANQIGRFFESEPDQVQAVTDVAKHIQRFWDPRMRAALARHIDSGGAGLLAIVVQACRQSGLAAAGKH